MSGNDGSGAGRRTAKDVSIRRRAAEAYLGRYFPRSAHLLEELRTGTMTDGELVKAVAAMTMEARSIVAPLVDGPVDSTSTNPESTVARALQAQAGIAARMLACQSVMAMFDDVGAAIREQLEELRQRRKEAQNAIILAAAQRPTIDRRVEKLAINLLSTDVSRETIARTKQDAQRMWNTPVDWSKLAREYGPIRFEETPHQGNLIADERLPPSNRLLDFAVDRTAFASKIEGRTGNELADIVAKELERWIAMNYPLPRYRDPEVMARAWLPLLMCHKANFSTSDRWVNSLMPSAWTKGKVMRAVRTQAAP